MTRTARIACRVTLGLYPVLTLLAACKEKEAGEGEEVKAVVTAKTAVAVREAARSRRERPGSLRSARGSRSGSSLRSVRAVR